MKLEWYRDGFIKIDNKIYSLAEAVTFFPNSIKEISIFVKTEIDRAENTKQIHQNNIDKILVIEEKVKKIIVSLNLKKCGKDWQENKENIYKIFKYIIQSSKYDEKIMLEKKAILNLNIDDQEKAHTMEINEIYNCLINHKSVCTSDSFAMSFILRALGFKAYHATTENLTDGGYHEVVLIIFDNESYICDPTIFREAFETGWLKDISKDYFIFKEKDYCQYICSGEREVVYVHPPIIFTENGEDMFKKGEDENGRQ